MATYELQKFNSPEMLEPEYRRKEAGCFVRVTTGFILVFLALILVAGVAAIVYFVQKDNLQTTNDDPQVTSVSAEKLKSDCEALAESGKLDQNKVCKYTQKKFNNNNSSIPKTGPFQIRGFVINMLLIRFLIMICFGHN